MFRMSGLNMESKCLIGSAVACWGVQFGLWTLVDACVYAWRNGGVCGKLECKDQQQIPGLGASYSLRQEMRVSFCLLPLFMG